jgi:hypothetical protein
VAGSHHGHGSIGSHHRRARGCSGCACVMGGLQAKQLKGRRRLLSSC